MQTHVGQWFGLSNTALMMVHIWYDTRPSVNRLAQDRADQISIDRVNDEIARRVRLVRDRGDFVGVHSVVDSSEVPDEQSARLVVLGPDHPHKGDASAAFAEAQKILDQRGTSPRIHRNMLAFVAPDKDRLTELQNAVRQSLAWTSIQSELESLNLDTFQRSQVTSAVTRSEDTVKARMQETYFWLIVPTQDDGVGRLPENS